MKHLRLVLLLVCGLAAATTARAQISVSVSIKERFHILHEPIVATTVVTNLTGRDITLSDTQQYQWFSFRIITDNDRVVMPRELHYKVPPLSVKAGETVKRTVDLHQLYDISEFGTYRIQANIYFDGLDKFFSSRPTHVEVTDGRTIWRRTAGVPEGQPGAGQMRVFSLISHQRGEINTLYVRVEDKDDGSIYCTLPIGRLLDGVPPQAEFDSANNLYVLQLIGNRSYVLTKITSNGQFAGQSNYSAPKTRPTLRKTADGALQIIGGRREAALAQNPAAEPAPKLSDRPLGLPAN
jgi:hypothetical protein